MYKDNLLDIQIFSTKQDMGLSAAQAGASVIRKAIADRGQASIIMATGASQFEMLEHLAQAPDIHWPSVTAFHLDEYVGLPITHPASFRLYLWQRFVSRLPLPIKAFHYLDGGQDAPEEASRVGRIITDYPIDVAFVGIGENGHLAFNDPPADFDMTDPYYVANLDKACRQQQCGEGWFPTLDNVPRQAISMSVHQIMQSQRIFCTVSDERKANAVRDCVQGPVTNLAPASILQQHANCTIYLDEPAASCLAREVS